MQGKQLKKNGLRITKNRKLVLKVLEESNEPISAEEIFNRVYKEIHLDYSTVYRILSVFTEKNITMKNIESDKIAYYQLNNGEHCHYLVCSECHGKVPIGDCPLHEICEKLSKETGYKITGHNLEFTGICPECQKKLKS